MYIGSDFFLDLGSFIFDGEFRSGKRLSIFIFLLNSKGEALPVQRSTGFLYSKLSMMRFHSDAVSGNGGIIVIGSAVLRNLTDFHEIL